MATIPATQSAIARPGRLAVGQASVGRKAAVRRAGLEVGSVYLLVALAVWAPPLVQFALSVAALGIVLWATARSYVSQRLWGLRVSRFWRSGWVLALALAVAAGAIATAAHFGTLQLPSSLMEILYRYGGYALWSGLQEFLLLNFFLVRLLRLGLGRQSAAVGIAVLFSLVHLPNPVLTPLTAVWGYLACLIFLRYRNFYVPAMVHALLGITIAITVPSQINHHMRVGLGYLTDPGYWPGSDSARGGSVPRNQRQL